MTGFLEALDQRVLVCDGAMGSLLYAKGVFINRCFDELNLTQPELVAEVHREYLRAGVDVLETNSFGANRIKLSNFGLADQAVAINREAARIARRVAAQKAWVAGSIGPLGVRVEPWGRTAVEEAEAIFREQAQALLDGGVDLFMLETFRDVNEIAAAVRAVRALSALPIVAQMTTEDDGHTLDGTPPERFTAELERAGADVIGVNCSVGPAAMLETIETMARVSRTRLAAQPNAGRPRDVEGRHIYLSSPEYLATYARRFVAAGARLVGGCCGTTPEHLRQIVQAVRAASPATRPTATVGAEQAVESADDAVAAVPRREKSALGAALADGRFVIVAEVSAPRGLDPAAAVAQAQRFHALGATVVNVPDYTQSGARVSALALAVLIERSGVETLLHYVARSRTLIGMQAELVGLHAMGLRNVLVTTGTPASADTYAGASSAFDVDAIGLINMVTRLGRGRDVGGEPLDAPMRWHVGATVNLFAPDPAAEWKRLAHKVRAGAEFLVTSPVLDREGLDPVFTRLRDTGLPVIASVPALEGARHAEFLAGEVAGVRVTEALIARLHHAPDEAAEGLAITNDTVAWLRERAHGLHVTSFHGSPATTEAVLRGLSGHQ